MSEELMGTEIDLSAESFDIELLQEILLGVSLGMWVDTAHSVVLSESFFEWYTRALSFDLLALMVDDPDKDPSLSWSETDIGRILELADPGSIEIVLTSWPYPDRRQIDELCKRLRSLMLVGPIAACENDLEWNWLSRNLNENDFDDMDAAGDYLHDAMRHVCSEQAARYEVTTHAYHPENSARSDVAPCADRMISQAYSVDSRKQKNPQTGETERIVVPFTGRHGPGRMQRLTFDRAMEIPRDPGGPELCAGLAAWAQRFTGLSAADNDLRSKLGLNIPVFAMLVALVATLPYSPLDIRWWSLKHVVGPLANPYASGFLRGLRAAQ